MDSKKKSISLVGAISIGIGGMVGGGIFAVLGEAVSLAHGATAIAFLIAGLVAMFTAYSYAKLSTRFQSQGGTVTFIDKAFGINLFSGSVNIMLWISYLVTTSLYAVAFSSYAMTFFPSNGDNRLLKHSLISLAIILPAIINFISSSFVSKSETYVVVLKVALLLFIIFTSIGSINIESLAPERWSDTFSIVVAGMIIFVAYEGFELIANAAEEIEKPEINLARAFYASVILVIVLYVLIAVITVGAVPEKILLDAKDYALAVAAEPALGKIGFSIVAIAALLATLSAINATIFGNSRLAYILAVEGELPKSMAKKRHGIPTNGIVMTVLFSLIIANSINLDQIAIIGSASFLLVFLIVNISALKLREKIKANLLILLSSCLISAIALLTLIIHTYLKSPNTILIFVSFIFISFAFEVFYGRLIRGHLFGRAY